MPKPNQPQQQPRKRKQPKKPKKPPRPGRGRVLPATKREKTLISFKDRSALQEADIYLQALRCPFAASAIGARIPDQYCYPTVTARLSGRVGLRSDANGTCSVYLSFNPLITLIDAAALATYVPGPPLLGTAAAVSVSTTTANSMLRYPCSNSVYAAMDPVASAATFSNWRVVGGGFVISSVTNATQSSGKYVVSAIPVAGPVPGPVFLTSGNSSGNLSHPVEPHKLVAIATGIVSPGILGAHIPESILAMPTSTSGDVNDLLQNALTINSRMITPAAYEFKSTNQNEVIWNSLAERPGMVTEVANSIDVAIEPGGTNNMNGFEFFLFSATGLPASTNVLDLRYVIHLEGSPKSSGTAGVAVPNSTQKSIVNPVALDRATAANNSAPPFAILPASAVETRTAKIVGTIDSIAKGVGSAALAFAGAGGGIRGGVAAITAGLAML